MRVLIQVIAALMLMPSLCAASPLVLIRDGRITANAALREGAMRVDSGPDGISLENGRIRWKLAPKDGALREEISAWRFGWKTLAISAPASASSSPLSRVNMSPIAAELTAFNRQGVVVTLRTGSVPAQVTRVELRPYERFVHIVQSVELTQPTPVEALQSAYLFLPEGRQYADYRPLDLVWTPLLRPRDGQVIGEHLFRSPAVVLQEGTDAAVLIPDLDLLAASSPLMQSILDLEVNDSSGAPRFAFGPMEHRLDGHVYYRHDPGSSREVGPGKLSWGYYLFADASVPAREAHRIVTRFSWARWGHRFFSDTRPQAASFERTTRCGFEDYCFPQIWRDLELDGKSVGGSVTGAFGSTDIWFQGWFNNLRTAYGLRRWGTRLGESGWVQKADRVKELLLAAPQERGIFPTIFDTSKEQWVNSCGRGAPREDFHTLDCSWSAYWLLRWEQDVEKDARIVPFCRRYADFLLQNQLPSGAIPSWFDPKTLQPRETFKECAETTASALFLAELYRVTRDPEYLAAARKAADYIQFEVLPEHKWYDFETYFSCAPKPLEFFDAHTQQHPQNNLSIHWAAEMYKTLYLATSEKRYLIQGESVLDYLALYQQVWAPPFIGCYGFGGFGVQNTDGEWHDARQAVFATTFADYYGLTGQPEYLERAIAAERAAWACMYLPENREVSPTTYAKGPLGNSDENYGHGGLDSPAGPSSFDWGPGSAAAGAISLLERYGQAFVDLRHRQGFGIDNCTITNLSISGRRVAFSLSTHANPKPVTVRFAGLSHDAYRVVINGIAKRYSSKTLVQGIRAMPACRAVRSDAPRFLKPIPNANLQAEASGTSARARMYLCWRLAGSNSAFTSVAMNRIGKTERWEVRAPKLPSSDGEIEYFYKMVDGDRTATSPSPYPESRPLRLMLTDAMLADCGDDNEAYLSDAGGSLVSDWSGGDERDRYVDGNSSFAYSFPIPQGAQAVEVCFRENGSGRVCIGEHVLLEEKDEGPGEIQDFRFRLTDPALWAGGKLSLRFWDVNPADGWGPNVAWIKVRPE